MTKFAIAFFRARIRQVRGLKFLQLHGSYVNSGLKRTNFRLVTTSAGIVSVPCKQELKQVSFSPVAASKSVYIIFRATRFQGVEGLFQIDLVLTKHYHVSLEHTPGNKSLADNNLLLYFL